MKREMTAPIALARVAALCSHSEQAESDIRQKLRRWGISHSDEEAIINRLLSENYINAQRYARAFVHDKFQFNGWGRIKISTQMRAKGIDAGTIAEALSTIGEQEYMERLRAVIASRYPADASSMPFAERRKAQAAVLRLAMSRGFEPALAIKALSEHDSIIELSEDYE